MLEGIDGLTPITTAPDPKQDTGELGRDEFLQMLIAQLENQDPLNPQDATEFTAQLATFSTLEQLVSIKDGVNSLVGAQAGDEGDTLRGINVIGKRIIAEGSQFELNGSGDAVPILFDLEGATSDVNVAVFDEAGRRVGEFDLRLLGAGRHQIDWDGTDAVGNQVPPGVYSFQVAALSGRDPVAARELVQGQVTGASIGDADPALYLGSVTIPLSKLVEVHEPEDDS